MVEKRKYAKWKATDISKALKQGIKPKPGPPGGQDELDLLEVFFIDLLPFKG
jgi:vacuolar protein sorting-associated protein VTA1